MLEKEKPMQENILLIKNQSPPPGLFLYQLKPRHVLSCPIIVKFRLLVQNKGRLVGH